MTDANAIWYGLAMYVVGLITGAFVMWRQIGGSWVPSPADRQEKK